MMMMATRRKSIALACCSAPCPSPEEIDQAQVYSVDYQDEAHHPRGTSTWKPGSLTMLAVPAG